jgi:hypothetical protein
MDADEYVDASRHMDAGEYVDAGRHMDAHADGAAANSDLNDDSELRILRRGG